MPYMAYRVGCLQREKQCLRLTHFWSNGYYSDPDVAGPSSAFNCRSRGGQQQAKQVVRNKGRQRSPRGEANLRPLFRSLPPSLPALPFTLPDILSCSPSHPGPLEFAHFFGNPPALRVLHAPLPLWPPTEPHVSPTFSTRTLFSILQFARGFASCHLRLRPSHPLTAPLNDVTFSKRIYCSRRPALWSPLSRASQIN